MKPTSAPFVFQPVLPGSLIGIVAPAGPTDATRLAGLPALYESFGYRCRVYPGCRRKTGYLAGTDDERLADLHAALTAPDVAAIHALRGGYGSMRLLDGIDTALLRRHPKPLLGYSDITALHALWCAHGLPSLHAPMPASDMLGPDGLAAPDPDRRADTQALFDILRSGVRAGEVWATPADALGTSATLTQDARPVGSVPGTAVGELAGGNLSLVAALLGTPWAWRLRGAVLFLEDVHEAPYRVDRLLTQLRLAGVLDAVAGVVLGSFKCDLPGPGCLAVVQQMLGGLGKPVLCGWPTGHGTPNRPLPLGLRVRLVAAAGGGGSLTWLAPATA